MDPRGQPRLAQEASRGERPAHLPAHPAAARAPAPRPPFLCLTELRCRGSRKMVSSCVGRKGRLSTCVVPAVGYGRQRFSASAAEVGGRCDQCAMGHFSSCARCGSAPYCPWCMCECYYVDRKEVGETCRGVRGQGETCETRHTSSLGDTTSLRWTSTGW